METLHFIMDKFNINFISRCNLTCDCAMDLCAILQLNSHRLMAEFHQKPAEKNDVV